MRLFVRLSLIGLVGLVALGFWLNHSTSVQTNQDVTVSDGMCQEPGTSIAVDFGSASDLAVFEKCVQNYSGNSWNLLVAVGLEVTGTEKYPIGFVCRINNYPDKALEKCIDTPGVKNGSWAFFIAESGQWKYSSYGASSHKSKCGSSEGWRFLTVGEPVTTFPRSNPTKHSCEK